MSIKIVKRGRPSKADIQARENAKPKAVVIRRFFRT
jgi:hypothetical protein